MNILTHTYTHTSKGRICLNSSGDSFFTCLSCVRIIGDLIPSYGEGGGGGGSRGWKGERGRGEMREEGNHLSKLWRLLTNNYTLTRLTQRTLLTEENTGRQGNVMNDAIRM